MPIWGNLASQLALRKANDATIELLEAGSLEELLPRFPSIFRESQQFLKDSLCALAEGLTTFETETVIRTLKGRKVFVFLKVIMPERDEKSSPVAVGFSIDITGRISAEEALRVNEEKYRILFVESPIPLWEADFSAAKQYVDMLRTQGISNFRKHCMEHPEDVFKCIALIKLIDVNDAALKFLQAESKEFLFTNFQAIFNEDLFTTHMKGLLSLIEGDTVFEDETMNTTLDGRKVFISFRMVVPKGYESTWSMILVSSVDITQLKLAERKLSKAYDELKEAHDRLEQRVLERTHELSESNRQLMKEIDERKRLEQELTVKNKDLEDFAFIVSHEVRNSIMGIRRILDLTVQKPELTTEYSHMLIASSDRLMKFVRNLLHMARAEHAIESREEVSLITLLPEILSLLKPDNITAELIIDRSLPCIMGEKEGIERVFTNLISNSITHLDSSKGFLSMELRYLQNDGYIDIFFRDNGTGISSDNIGKVFDKAFTTKTDENFGFGLAIVKKIVEKHGGTVKVSSEGIGKGAEFTITLPS